MRRVGALRQVALSAGRDIDDTLGFWLDVFGLPVHARYDPPGIAFIIAGNVRLFFTGGVPQATVYLDIADLDSFYETASDNGVAFTTAPTLVHRDAAGEFGPAGECEWMAFLKDPAGNTIGLVERRT
ncbi:Glyoxalase-like domain protein [Aminobacter sp. MSH1]|uniref:Catechol 2,3-dioxygenase-like lactoylglutathione lyase family enzyme n=1 Tax=Aminobacter niigataensis TaxID=83265 RepID=A0ABR6KZ14_9HYPH|nr:MULTISPECIES: VOC family protein [Aminobacter]AWC24278.1 Glyoxalase-like domain protein [Aminobacter sp. MSH1]MBB4649663.1 catechol 2,3-dioxygenase-like lactoylglutathione lyase family enzyme [Aminobacter niigataensis]